MVSNLDQFSQDYRAAALALTIAVSEMVNSVETPEFNDAFWRVQRVNERCKQLRAAMEDAAKSSNIYSLISA